VPDGTDAPSLHAIEQGDLTDESYSDADQQERVEWVVRHSIGPVLDIGCGHGYMLRQYDVPSVGIDFDRRRIIRAQTQYRDYKHVFFCVDAEFGIPFGDQQFETVWLCEVLEHCHWSDAQYILTEALRVSSKRVIITLPKMGGPTEPYHMGDVENDDHRWYATSDMLARLLGDLNWTQALLAKDRFIGLVIDE